MVKETFSVKGQDRVIIYGKVSIPSRGSGKGDSPITEESSITEELFQSPLGEVVKET